MKYYIKVTCAFKWARKLPRKTVTYESAKCVSCNTRKCTHNGFVSDLLKWALKCRFYATGPWNVNLKVCWTLYEREWSMFTELTWYSFWNKLALVQTSKNTITPHTSELDSTSKYKLLTSHLKNMMFCTSLWTGWNIIHVRRRCAVRNMKIWTLKQLQHCTQRLNHEDI